MASQYLTILQIDLLGQEDKEKRIEAERLKVRRERHGATLTGSKAHYQSNQVRWGID
jgi:hypothetical protein